MLVLCRFILWTLARVRLSVDIDLPTCNATKVTESVEKMRAKERFINSQHDGLREEYVQVGMVVGVVAVGMYD